MEVDVTLGAQLRFITEVGTRNNNLIMLPQECIAFFAMSFHVLHGMWMTQAAT